MSHVHGPGIESSNLQCLGPDVLQTVPQRFNTAAFLGYDFTSNSMSAFRANMSELRGRPCPRRKPLSRSDLAKEFSKGYDAFVLCICFGAACQQKAPNVVVVVVVAVVVVVVIFTAVQ